MRQECKVQCRDCSAMVGTWGITLECQSDGNLLTSLKASKILEMDGNTHSFSLLFPHTLLTAFPHTVLMANDARLEPPSLMMDAERPVNCNGPCVAATICFPLVISLKYALEISTR